MMDEWQNEKMNARKGDHEERAEDAPKWVSVPRETGEPKGVKAIQEALRGSTKSKNEKMKRDDR